MTVRRHLRVLGIALWAIGLLLPGTSAAQETRVFTLAEALQYALEHYPAVQGALEQVNASAAGVRVARSSYLPRLDALWQTNRATVNNVTGQLLPQSVVPSISGPPLAATSMQSVWGTAAGGFFSWEPFDFGLRGAGVEEAEAGLARARASEAVSRLNVQGAVASAFLAVVAGQQALVAADADVERRDVLARVARALADNQLRPGAEASRAAAEHAAARTRAIQARQAVAIAEATLAQMLGATAAVTVSTAGLMERAPGASAAATPTTHPILETGRAAVDLARARERVMETTNRPRVFLQSSLFARGSGAEPNGDLVGGSQGLWLQRTNWATGVQVVFPNLFEFAALRARRAEAAALTRIEDSRLSEARLGVTAQQRTADAIVDAARAIALNTPVQLDAARQSEAQARARYEAGLASIVEVAETQGLLADAEIRDALARVDVWRALLAQAVSRGDMTSFVAAARGPGVQ